MPRPVIAAINGAAAGKGFSLALAYDFRVMAKSTFLRQAYTSRGLNIDGGGSFVLPRLVGLGRPLEILAFDRPISSEQAMAWGLVIKIVKDEDVIEEATEMARELASGSPASFGWSKRLLTYYFDSSFETQIERERREICAWAETPEGTEGLRGFAEKRKPVFTSRQTLFDAQSQRSFCLESCLRMETRRRTGPNLPFTGEIIDQKCRCAGNRLSGPEIAYGGQCRFCKVLPLFRILDDIAAIEIGCADSQIASTKSCNKTIGSLEVTISH